jgi:hypothetical protein
MVATDEIPLIDTKNQNKMTKHNERETLIDKSQIQNGYGAINGFFDIFCYSNVHSILAQTLKPTKRKARSTNQKVPTQKKRKKRRNMCYLGIWFVFKIN